MVVPRGQIHPQKNRPKKTVKIRIIIAIQKTFNHVLEAIMVRIPERGLKVIKKDVDLSRG